MSGTPGARQAEDQAVGSRWDLGPGVRAAVSGRAGGVSEPPYDRLNLGAAVGDDPAAVAANRAVLAAACGLPADSLAWMRQVHGTQVRYVGQGGPGQGGPGRGDAGAAAVSPGEPADAMYTDVPGLALCVLVADCAAVLLADPAAGLVGAAHAGREGMAAGVVPALVEVMTSAGAAPARMRALIGPAICGGCYEVPEDMRARVAGLVPAAGCATRSGAAGLDIVSGVRSQLAALGVAEVSSDGRCTAESPELFSYRREGRTGRFAGLVWLVP